MTDDATQFAPEPEYEARSYYFVVSTRNTGEPRALRRSPERLAADELLLEVEVLVPKMARRLAQKISIVMPNESAHVATIKVSVPEAEAGE